MAHITVDRPFDMDRVAAAFPGQLRFRGAPAGSPHTTEILGDVDEKELLAVVFETPQPRPYRRVVRKHAPLAVAAAVGAAAAELLNVFL